MRYLASSGDSSSLVDQDAFPLSEDAFLDEARIHHPELSDDNLCLIYRLGLDEWSKFGFNSKSPDQSNILLPLAFMASHMLEEYNGWPRVHFNYLFRWREVTQLLGEDLLTCALLAFNDKFSSETNRLFDWPSTIHNDNPDLNFLFQSKKLCELHSHLKATTSTFEISWVSLMNHISGLDKKFNNLIIQQEPSNRQDLGKRLYEFVIEAAWLRRNMYQATIQGRAIDSYVFTSQYSSARDIDSTLEFERRIMSDNWIPDYICVNSDSPMSIYSGERRLIYSVLKTIYATNNLNLTNAFYRYILIKNTLRRYLIQTNQNIGFSNFQRFQNLKTNFLDSHYKHFPFSLPLWEARKHNYTKLFESRIAPLKSKQEFLKCTKLLHKFILPQENLTNTYDDQTLSNKDWLLIFHFLKRKFENPKSHLRDLKVRKSTRDESIALSYLSSLFRHKHMDAAIDAASSEFACRPEVYGQAFRFLRHYGFDATFHAGEDFYDIADGLRAIDETIHFLKLKPGDRIGHALALGIDANKYYSSRHHMVALPKQWMLDNVVWILMKSKKIGINIDTKTEWFLNNTYKHLANELGYSAILDSNGNNIPDITDYWDSLILRGDDPDMYNANATIKDYFSPSPQTWEHYALLDSEQTNFVRESNPRARRIFLAYHSSEEIRKNGEKVKAFPLPPGYAQLITDMQNAMIKEISKRQLCIECCPSSNVRIGRLNRFENHPIFRFSPINPSDTRYPLAVTVNTDDLGVFSTSLPNEYSLLALALLKKKDHNGNHIYSKQEVYDWISRMIDNGYKYTFIHGSELPEN